MYPRVCRVCARLSVSAWAAFCGGAPPGQRGGVRPSGCPGFHPQNGRSATCGAPGALLWGGASPGPQAPGRAQAGPAPDPAPSTSPRRPRSPGAGAQAPEPSRGAETTAAAPVGCGDRAPGAAEPAPSALSPAPSRVRAEPQPPIPGPWPGDQQVSEHTRALQPRPGRNPLTRSAAPARPEPPLPAAAQLSSPRVRASNRCAPLPCPGSAGRLPPPSLPPRVGRGEEGAQSSLAGGDPRERGASANRCTPPPLPFPSGFPNALSRAGGGGAAAPASRPILAQARGGSGIGTRLPEARDPKVRTATRRVESGGTDREGLGMEEGAMPPPPFSGSRGAVRWGCPLWG